MQMKFSDGTVFEISQFSKYYSNEDSAERPMQIQIEPINTSDFENILNIVKTDKSQFDIIDDAGEIIESVVDYKLQRANKQYFAKTDEVEARIVCLFFFVKQ